MLGQCMLVFKNMQYTNERVLYLKIDVCIMQPVIKGGSGERD